VEPYLNISGRNQAKITVFFLQPLKGITFLFAPLASGANKKVFLCVLCALAVNPEKEGAEPKLRPFGGGCIPHWVREGEKRDG